MDFYRTFIEEKARCKRHVLGSMFFPRTPVLLINMGEGKISANLKKECESLITGLAAIGVTTLVYAPNQLRLKWPESRCIHGVHSFKEAIKAADFVIDFDQQRSALREYGCVPIVQREGEETVDYNPLKESGDGFYFNTPNRWEMFAAVLRACETYNFPYDWENLIRRFKKKS